MEWNGKWYGMEGEFWCGIWKMLRMEWIGRFEKWNGKLSSIPTTYNRPIYQNFLTNYKVLPNWIEDN